jgi:hypothetical protein
MAHREQERSRGAGGGPWADIELGSASVSAPCGGWGSRDVSSVCRRAFCSARRAVPGAGLTSFRSGAARRRLWRGPSAEIGARRVFPQTAARRRGFLDSFFRCRHGVFAGGWLEYLGEVVAVVASGRFLVSYASWGPRLAGAGACLSSFTSSQLAVLMDVGLGRLHAPTGFCAIGAVLVAAWGTSTACRMD